MPTIICVMCGRKVNGKNTRQKTCDDCRPKYNRLRVSHGRTIGSEDVCDFCGKKFVRTGPGQMYCHDCRATRRNVDNSGNIRNVPAVCEICGIDFYTSRATKARTCGKLCAAVLRKRSTEQGSVEQHASQPYQITECDFATMQTGCAEYRSWDCAEMDPMTSRAELVVRVNVVEQKQKRKKAA